MPFASSKSNFTCLENLGLNDSLGIQFSGRTSDPSDADLAAGRLYYSSYSSTLKVYNGSSWVALGPSGGSGVSSWEAMYLLDDTFALTAGTWTITQSGAFAILSLTKTNVGAGAVVSISNSGTGADITANSGSWFFKSSGGVGILEIGSGGTINATGGACTIGKSATATTFAGSVVVTGTAAAASITLTAGNIITSAGGLSLTKAANNATLSVTNNTATTASVIEIAGSGVFTGSTTTSFMTITPSGLTTGTAVYLPVAAMTSGTALSIVANAATSGILVNLASNSSDVSSRRLLNVENTHASAVGCVPLSLKQGAATSTNYYKLTTYVTASGTVTLWIGNGTTANGALFGTAGDMLINGGSNKPEMCTGTTNWTALV